MEYLEKSLSYIGSIIFPKIYTWEEILKLEEPQRSIQIARVYESARQLAEETNNWVKKLERKKFREQLEEDEQRLPDYIKKTKAVSKKNN